MYDWVRDKSVADKLRRRKKRALRTPGQDHRHANRLRLRRLSSCRPPHNSTNLPLLLRSNAQTSLLSYKQLLTKLLEGKMKVQCVHDNVEQTTDA